MREQLMSSEANYYIHQSCFNIFFCGHSYSIDFMEIHLFSLRSAVCSWLFLEWSGKSCRELDSTTKTWNALAGQFFNLAAVWNSPKQSETVTFLVVTMLFIFCGQKFCHWLMQFFDNCSTYHNDVRSERLQKKNVLQTHWFANLICLEHMTSVLCILMAFILRNVDENWTVPKNSTIIQLPRKHNDKNY